MTSDEVQQRLKDEPDFINLKRFDYSLKALLARYPEGVPARLLASALDLSEEEADAMYEGVLLRLRKALAR
jgi:hypothetical protein